jgi:hypothetical protein
MKGKTKVIISDELIEKVLDDMEKAQETVLTEATEPHRERIKLQCHHARINYQD